MKLQTRRQSRGIAYFDRLKPKMQITIGDLEDWYQEKYGGDGRLNRMKRRKLNKTVDDISMDGIGEEEEEDGSNSSGDEVI